jgi:mannose-6-phosphate isomerase
VLYPLTFHPIFKERVWGGHNLEHLYGKELPPGVPIGESWEITDRPGDVSVIANGPLAGKDLHWLVEHHRDELLGAAALQGNRFPLLVKLLDAQEKLSLQVHPPAHKAAELRGEPKTEMWYIAEAVPGAGLYVGLKRGVSRAAFEQKIRDGSVADCFHYIPVKAGDAMFLPSGRVHAIGAGLVVFEIQQNSDTTYRVFDWNRVGLDGQPRALHLAESLASIDFSDFEPTLIPSTFSGAGPIRRYPLVQDPLFTVEGIQANAVATVLKPQAMQIIACLGGTLRVGADGEAVRLTPGGFCLVPACLECVKVSAEGEAAFLRVEGRSALSR